MDCFIVCVHIYICFSLFSSISSPLKGTGYFGVRNKGANERSLRSELENGRLAMIAFLGQVIAELVTGLSPYEQIQQTLGN